MLLLEYMLREFVFFWETLWKKIFSFYYSCSLGKGLERFSAAIYTTDSKLIEFTITHYDTNNEKILLMHIGLLMLQKCCDYIWLFAAEW